MEGPVRWASGHEWLVDAYGCRADCLVSTECLQRLIAALVDDLDLHPVGEPQWHVFPEPGGVTGLVLLRESHVTVHTFPERGFAAFNLYCCRSRPTWPWEEQLKVMLGADRVLVHTVERGAPPP